jgi:2-polyprenyl-6-hydroxyphenyl methylase/3-demethylubiquinone-9 3-methyltransferase
MRPSEHVTAQSSDSSSDPRFVDYYIRASASDRTQKRFAGIVAAALELRRRSGQAVAHLDVVDVGCGAGTQSLMWARAGHQVRAIDINEPLVAAAGQRARAEKLSAAVCVGSATQLPFATASADIVLLPELLEHVPAWQDCLAEAIRVLREGGLLYISTTNALCPLQQEYTLPLYAWYPARLKRWCERMVVTTHPEWVNHARYPAVNWFTYFGLHSWMRRREMRTWDRFDVLAVMPLSRLKRAIVAVVRTVPGARLIGHVLSEGTSLWAVKGAHS